MRDALPEAGEWRRCATPCPRARLSPGSARCHGADGRGNGPDAASLKKPKPYNLVCGHHTDQYMFYRIAEGGFGVPVCSEMPAFKASLTEEERWKLVTFLGIRFVHNCAKDAGADASDASRVADAQDGSTQPIAPTFVSVAPVSGGLHLMWVNGSPDCDTTEIERNSNGIGYSFAYAVAGAATEKHDDHATSPGSYCYHARCSRGGVSSGYSAELCASH